MAESLVGKIVSNAGKQWSRNTVADGNWLNSNTVQKFNENDKTLAEAIESVSAAMEHFTPEITPSAWPCTSNQTIQTIEQNADGSLNVTYQPIESSSTSDDSLWSLFKQNEYASVLATYTETAADFNHVDGALSESLTIPAGIYDIKIEVLYEPTQSTINNKLDIAISKSTSIDDDALYQTFILFDDSLIKDTTSNPQKIDVQSEWITGIINLEAPTTLKFLIKGESAQGRYKLNNIYISSIAGAKGDAGFSPLFTITDVDTGTYTQGGKHVAIQYGDGGLQNTAFDILNGIDGTDSTVNLFGNNGVSVTKDGTNYTVGLSGGYYSDTLSAYSAMYAGYASNAKFSDNSVSAMDQIKGSIDWGNQIASEYATHSGNFVTSSSQVITGDKQYALTTTGWAEIDIPAVGGEYLPLSGGTVSGATYFSAATGQNILAVASAASLVGASRQTSANFGQNASALGTTWMGVGGPDMYRGFLKYTQDGNVGDLDSNNTMQVEFTPNAKGTIFAQAKNSGSACPETQILNPIKASCDAMVQSANANSVSGPNYMLAKNADGQFVIGAACINCSALSAVTLSANTYYFVYEV